MLALKNVVRRFLDNRRRHPRLRRCYPVVLWDEHKEEVFRGKVNDISRSGVSLTGFHSRHGVSYGQTVLARILVFPSNLNQTAEEVALWGRVCRLDERDSSAEVALEFCGTLPEEKLA